MNTNLLLTSFKKITLPGLGPEGLGDASSSSGIIGSSVVEIKFAFFLGGPPPTAEKWEQTQKDKSKKRVKQSSLQKMFASMLDKPYGAKSKLILKT